MLDPMTTDRIPADRLDADCRASGQFQRVAQYAIDQFVMRGGHAIVFLDPLSEASVQGGPASQDQGDKSSSPLARC
jgi:ABC-type uncharacterized transport system involved in gliding motility auxiliary subunit